MLNELTGRICPNGPRAQLRGPPIEVGWSVACEVNRLAHLSSVGRLSCSALLGGPLGNIDPGLIGLAKLWAVLIGVVVPPSAATRGHQECSDCSRPLIESGSIPNTKPRLLERRGF